MFIELGPVPPHTVRAQEEHVSMSVAVSYLTLLAGSLLCCPPTPPPASPTLTTQVSTFHKADALTHRTKGGHSRQIFGNEKDHLAEKINLSVKFNVPPAGTEHNKKG